MQIMWRWLTRRQKHQPIELFHEKSTRLRRFPPCWGSDKFVTVLFLAPVTELPHGSAKDGSSIQVWLGLKRGMQPDENSRGLCTHSSGFARESAIANHVNGGENRPTFPAVRAHFISATAPRDADPGRES